MRTTSCFLDTSWATRTNGGISHTRLDEELKEAYALELFRTGRLTHYELSKVLGLDRFETFSRVL
jgi:predicted HTH domain antitoxin